MEPYEKLLSTLHSLRKTLLFLGVAIGSYIAWRRGGIAEGSIITSSLFFYNMPTFWIGLIMIWLFAYKWTFFPLGGFTGMDETISHFHLSGTEWYRGMLDFLWHMALPLIVEVGFEGASA